MLNNLLIFILTGLRPLLGPAVCRFPLSCTDFAVKQLREKRLLPAMQAITKRLLACQPFFLRLH